MRQYKNVTSPLVRGMRGERGSSDSGSRLFELVEQTSLDKVGSLTRSDERSEASGL